MKNRSFVASLAWKLSFIVVILIWLIVQIQPISAAPTIMVLPQSNQTQVLPPPANTPTRTPTPINIGNKVWDDLDQDGRQDAGEPGLAGVVVQLWNPGKTSLIDSAVTSASGTYTVIAPIPGDYRVRVVLPSAGDSFSPKDMAGGDNTLDSDINPSGASLGFTDTFTLASNVISISSVDAGIIKFKLPTPTRTPTPINIGNKVWDDLDQDGMQDAGEPGLAGVVVQLWNPGKTSLIDSAVTSASGAYTVIAPIPGNYRVRVVLPGAGDSFSPKNMAGGDDTLDSDINPSGASLGFTDTFTLASNVISITSIDAGIITPTPPVIVRRSSIDNQDGEIESNNGTEGAVVRINSLRLGDLATGNHPVRGILSFNLSLPANATIISAQIRVVKSNLAGSPFASLGNLTIDIANPNFGSSTGLSIEDFQSPSSTNSVAILNQVGTTDTYSGKLNATGISLINKNGITQFRLRFTTLTDSDLTSDFIKFYGGEYTTASKRPKLIIKYTLP